MNENETEDIMHHAKVEKSASSSVIEVAKNGIHEPLINAIQT